MEYLFLLQVLCPFLVTVIFTLLGYLLGRFVGRRQGYDFGYADALIHLDWFGGYSNG